MILYNNVLTLSFARIVSVNNFVAVILELFADFLYAFADLFAMDFHRLIPLFSPSGHFLSKSLLLVICGIFPCFSIKSLPIFLRGSSKSLFQFLDLGIVSYEFSKGSPLLMVTLFSIMYFVSAFLGVTALFLALVKSSLEARLNFFRIPLLPPRSGFSFVGLSGLGAGWGPCACTVVNADATIASSPILSMRLINILIYTLQELCQNKFIKKPSVLSVLKINITKIGKYSYLL